MQHFFFHCVCEDGYEIDYDLVKENQQEAERILKRNGANGFNRLENHKIVWSAPLKSFELIEVKDPHDTVSPQCWPSYQIELTSLDDMLERQKQYCMKRKDDPDLPWNKNSREVNEQFGLMQTYEAWEQMMLDSVREIWGLETPETLERERLKKKFEQNYSRNCISKQQYNARKRWAKEYTRMWNEWDLGKYDKWTFQEMLDGCGYKSYYDLNNELVVLPCYDDVTPPLNENGEQISENEHATE